MSCHEPPSATTTLSSQTEVSLSTARSDDASTSEEDECFVIVAQDVTFTVHRSRIESHSATLDALLKRPADSDDPQERISNCPVIRVQDTAYDFQHLLYILYGLCKPHLSVAPHFALLAAWTRIGTKYDLRDLTTHALAHLRTLFPSTLAGWDARDRSQWQDRFRPQDAIEALNLLRSLGDGQRDMLPAAVYLCAQLPARTLRNGTKRADGTPEKLAAADVKLVLGAQECLRGHGARVLENACGFARAAPGECAGAGDGCYDALVSRIGALSAGVKNAHSKVRALVNGDPLHRGLLEFIDECVDADADGQVGVACAACVRHAREHVERLRVGVWADLPRVAGVQDARAWGLDS